MRKLFKVYFSYIVIALITASCQQERFEPINQSSFVLKIPDDEQFLKLSIALRYAAHLEPLGDIHGRTASSGRTANTYYPPSNQPITPASYEAGIVQSGVSQFGEGFRQEWANFQALPQIQQITNNFNNSGGFGMAGKIIDASTVSSNVKSQLRSFASQCKTRYDQLATAEQYNPYLTEAFVVESFDQLAGNFTTQVTNNAYLTQNEKNALFSDIRHFRENIQTYGNTVSQVNSQQIAAGGRISAEEQMQKTRFGKFLVKFGNFVTTVVVITGLAILVAVTAKPDSPEAKIDIFKTAGKAALLGLVGLFKPWNEQIWWT